MGRVRPGLARSTHPAGRSGHEQGPPLTELSRTITPAEPSRPVLLAAAPVEETVTS